LKSSVQILVVSQPGTPGQDPLPYTTKEAAEIGKHFPDEVRYLDGAHATTDAVIDAMKECSWVHFACHGIQASEGDPTKSAFLLHDGRLELSRLMSTSLPRAELAVLSACQTAKGDGGLPDEAVHLAAGMLAAGYRSVVATLWSINDADGPVLADALYAALKRNRNAGGELKVAQALHEAVGQLRKTVGEAKFEHWVPFVHYGV
jgi:CHAT domain-containing protein